MGLGEAEVLEAEDVPVLQPGIRELLRRTGRPVGDRGDRDDGGAGIAGRLRGIQGDDPVVEVSSTMSTRRPSIDGPSMRCWSPWALPALRTTKASSRSPSAAAAWSMAVATGSAPSVSPPTAS